MAIKIKNQDNEYLSIPQLQVNGLAIDAKLNIGYIWLRPYGFEKDKLSVEVFYYKSKADRIPDAPVNVPSSVILITDCNIFDPDVKTKIHSRVIDVLKTSNPKIDFEAIDV